MSIIWFDPTDEPSIERLSQAARQMEEIAMSMGMNPDGRDLGFCIQCGHMWWCNFADDDSERDRDCEETEPTDAEDR